MQQHLQHQQLLANQFIAHQKILRDELTSNFAANKISKYLLILFRHVNNIHVIKLFLFLIKIKPYLIPPGIISLFKLFFFWNSMVVFMTRFMQNLLSFSGIRNKKCVGITSNLLFEKVTIMVYIYLNKLEEINLIIYS